MKAILYTICSYLPEDEQLLNNLHPNVVGMEKWAKYKGIDFKVYDKIPARVEEIFNETKTKWSRTWNNKRKNHMRKAWCTKFEAYHHFYKNNYDQMLFLDCDMRPKSNKINRLAFNYTNFFSCNIKSKSVDSECHPMVVAESMLKRELDCRAGAQTMYLTKDFEHNLSNVFSYENVLAACLKDYRCIREEVFMTYILHKLDIMKKVERMPFRLNCQDIRRPEKINFIYNNEWEKIIE